MDDKLPPPREKPDGVRAGTRKAEDGGVATPPRAENGLLRELVAEEDGGEADGEEVEQRFHGFPTVGTTAKKTSGSTPSLTRVCSWPSGQKWQSPGPSGSGTPSHVAVPLPERT